MHPALCRNRRLAWSLAMSAFIACSDAGTLGGDAALEEAAVAAMDADASEAASSVGFAAPPAPEGLALSRNAGLAGQGGAAPPPSPALQSPARENRIIRTGDARLEVEGLERAIEQVQNLAERSGGWVAQSSLDMGERQRRSARLEVKIPAGRWDEVVSGLDAIGELRQLSTASEDVGEQYVDLEAQLANARRLEERYLELLDSRTGSVEDLLAVERELGRVRERIESLQGRLRYLDTRIATSTLTVTLEEPVGVLSSAPEAEPIRDAFRAAWRNFLGLVTGAIAIAGVVVPLGLVAAALAWTYRACRRRRPGPAEVPGG